MDEVSEGIFKNGLEKWAAGLRSGEVAAALMTGNEKDGKLLSELKYQLMDTHYYWVKMTIPDYCIISMNELAPNAIELIFDTLDIYEADGSKKAGVTEE